MSDAINNGLAGAAASAASPANAVTGAIRKAAASTGVGFDYLYRVAMRESALNPAARAQTSSAAGLFQFIESTWLEAVKKYGAAHGLADQAKAISTDAKGRAFVADATKRQEILNLRFDADKAAALAGELARENRAALEKGLGRAVDAAELYAAHFLGAGGAKKLLAAAATTSAASILPAAAAANRHVFYDGARALSVSEVVDGFRRTIGEAKGVIRDISHDLGERIEKSLAPLLRETASLSLFERAGATPGRIEPMRMAPISPLAFETRSLPPLVLAVLQALDPAERSRGKRD